MSTCEAEGAGIGTPISIEHFIPSRTLPGTDLSDVFEGREHGDVPVSMFLSTTGPAMGQSCIATLTQRYSSSMRGKPASSWRPPR